MHDNTQDTEALNTKYLEIERSYQKARLYSNRADSTTCPCQIDTEDLDVLSCIIDDLRKGYGQEGNKVERLHDALNPIADALIAIACLEQDDAALATAKRIKTLLLA